MHVAKQQWQGRSAAAPAFIPASERGLGRSCRPVSLTGGQCLMRPIRGQVEQYYKYAAGLCIVVPAAMKVPPGVLPVHQP